jgi:hypothetical protein
MKNCALLVCSCDKNEDLWPMFFYYMYQNWKDCRLPIYLNTENKVYCDKNYEIKTFQMFPHGDGDKWSLRLRKHLEQIAEEYVILILDDFFLLDTVDERELNWCLEEMKKNKNIAVFLFDPTPGPNVESPYANYERKGKKAPFRMSLQAGIWNKQHLLHFLRNHEGPWQFETWGSVRSRRYKEDFYALKRGVRPPFVYSVGGVIADNKWRGREACEFIVRDFGIDLDETRGVYEDGDARKTEIRHRSFLEKCIGVAKSLI